MALTEKTAIAIYINSAIVVLLATLFFRLGRTLEAFQAMGIPGTATPIVKCIGSDGVSKCRFIDVAGSTPNTLLIRERTNSVPQKCGKTPEGIQLNYDSATKKCTYSSTSSTGATSSISMDPLASPICPLANETYFASIDRCAVTAGTVPRCIPDGATVDSAEVKTAMPCYAKRFADTEASVKNLGNDITLLWNEWSTLGVYNLRSPCCDPTTAPVPAGSIRIGTLVVEKDWKFWTIVGLGITVILIFIMMLMR